LEKRKKRRSLRLCRVGWTTAGRSRSLGGSRGLTRLLEEFLWEAALANHGADGADGDVFAGMGDDDGVACLVSILGVAAALGGSDETGALLLGICFLGGVLEGVAEEIGEGRKGVVL